ncbi:tetratricopeptide repeat protein [Paraherbaspirillum soli]|uniref:Tetratricopeptide repeat protein n=1 Tax=Paraherbaspirillum soli TaxID=631222 RepID=A0ABW0M5M8_9BURK
MDEVDIFLQADAAYDTGDLASAFNLFLQAAEKGNCDAMCRIALMYESGEGIACDIDKSIYWDLKAIDAGSTTSLLNLGITYRRLGNIRKAKYWFEKSLETGDGEAALELARLYSVSDKEIDTVKRYLNIAISSNSLSEASLEEARELSSL